MRGRSSRSDGGHGCGPTNKVFGMAIEFIPTRADRAKFPTLNHLVDSIINNGDRFGIGDGVLYYGWPKYTDYESVRHSIDLALITRRIGLVLVRVVSAAEPSAEIIDSVSQVSASAVSQLTAYPSASGNTKSCSGEGERMLEQITNATCFRWP